MLIGARYTGEHSKNFGSSANGLRFHRHFDMLQIRSIELKWIFLNKSALGWGRWAKMTFFLSKVLFWTKKISWIKKIFSSEKKITNKILWIKFYEQKFANKIFFWNFSSANFFRTKFFSEHFFLNKFFSEQKLFFPAKMRSLIQRPVGSTKNS